MSIQVLPGGGTGIKIFPSVPDNVHTFPGQVTIISGDSGLFEYEAPAAATVHDVTHQFGYDPVAIQVFDEDGVFYDEFGVQFLVPGQVVRISFDVQIKATVRLA